MWGIKLKGFIRQVDLSYTQGNDDNGEEGKDDNVKVKEDNDKGGMNDKHNLLLVYHVRNQTQRFYKTSLSKLFTRLWWQHQVQQGEGRHE